MFKRFHCTLFLFLSAGMLLFGQNLVYNGSFEQYDSCPYSGGQLNKAIFWFSANTGLGGSSEYFNACDNPGLLGVPNNYIGGHQYARTGNAYVGTGFYEEDSEYREYVEGTLVTALQSNVSYCVSFYVSLSSYSTFGIDALGVYFTNDSLITHSIIVHLVDAQVENEHMNIITDKENWVKISGSFTATGGERFFTIGNFKSNAQTDTSILIYHPSGYSYYLIDDVVVNMCDAPVYAANCGPDLCIHSMESITLGTNELPEYEYYWFNSDSNLIATSGYLSMMPLQSDTFYLMVRDFKYDISWDTVHITVSENCNEEVLYAANVFSPNNDGNNDMFFIRGKNISQMILKVYNRWGALIFEGNDPNQGWDGRFHDHDCPEGVYYFVAEVKYEDGSTALKKGNVTIIR